MRRSLVLVVSIVGVACRRGSSSAPAPAASDSAAPVTSASVIAETPRAPRFSGPIAATMRGADVFVAGANRDGTGVGVSRYPLDGGAFERVGITALAGTPRLADVDWVAGAGAIGLVVDTGSSVQALVAGDVAGLATALWEPSDGGACAAGNRLLSIGRADGGFSVAARAVDGARDTIAIPAGLSASLACGARSAVVIVDDGGRRVARRVGTPEDVTLGGDDEERAFSLVPTTDGFLAVRLGARGLAFRWWDDTLGPWIRASIRLADDATLELVVATPEIVALVISRSTPAARACASGDDTDAVAELVTLDRADGKQRRDPERLDRWTCGADPGPFFGGVAGGKIVVAWPRGASTACARVGVRWGGVAWVATSGAAPMKVARIDAPAEALADAGCDGARCAIVALSRARDGACVPASDDGAGEVRVLALAP